MKEIIKIFNNFNYKFPKWKVFSDFIEMTSISYINVFSKNQNNEDRFKEIMASYNKIEQGYFPQILGELILLFEEKYDDYLGKLFMELGLNNHWTGQFFTPYTVSKTIAEMNYSRQDKSITLNDPACGSAGMIVAYADSLKEKGINPQKVLKIDVSDIDINCVRMAYIQLSLLGLRAVVHHRDTLTMKTWKSYYTPFYSIPAHMFFKEKQQVFEFEKNGQYKLFA